jgi:chromosome condensin MukBEF complex kleisin-like MukF subunit
VDKVRVYHDRVGNTLTVWFDDPWKEAVCEEVDDDVVLMKDRRGRVIGFEQLNYPPRRLALVRPIMT